jgi:hypothetical protein
MKKKTSRFRKWIFISFFIAQKTKHKNKKSNKQKIEGTQGLKYKLWDWMETDGKRKSVFRVAGKNRGQVGWSHVLC